MTIPHFISFFAEKKWTKTFFLWRVPAVRAGTKTLSRFSLSTGKILNFCWFEPHEKSGEELHKAGKKLWKLRGEWGVARQIKLKEKILRFSAPFAVHSITIPRAAHNCFMTTAEAVKANLLNWLLLLFRCSDFFFFRIHHRRGRRARRFWCETCAWEVNLWHFPSPDAEGLARAVKRGQSSLRLTHLVRLRLSVCD
jgi:hypothetical protein